MNSWNSLHFVTAWVIMSVIPCGTASDTIPRGSEAVSLSEELQAMDEAGATMPEEAFVRRGVTGIADGNGIVDNSTPVETSELAPTPSGENSQSEEAEVIAIDEFENNPDAEAGSLWDGVSWIGDLISPTDPNGRDNLAIGFGSSVGYDDNVLFSSSNKFGSGTASAFGNLAYSFGSPRFELRTRVGAGVKYYENRPGAEQNTNFSFQLASQYQFRPRLGMEFNTVTTYLDLPNPQLIGGTFAFNGGYLFNNTNFDVSYVFRPSVSFVAGYNLNAIRYDLENVNEQSGFISQTFSLTANWLFTPRSTALLNLRYNPISYYEAGISSEGYILLIGMTQTVSPRFEWTLRVGGEFRSINNPDPIEGAATEYTGPFLEGEMEYSYSPNSTILGTLRFGSEPSGVSAVTIRTSFRAGLLANQEFGPRLSGQVGLFYQNDNFDQPGPVADYSQENYTAQVSLRYAINPSIATTVRYEYLILNSELPNSNYTRSFASVGLDFAF